MSAVGNLSMRWIQEHKGYIPKDKLREFIKTTVYMGIHRASPLVTERNANRKKLK